MNIKQEIEKIYNTRNSSEQKCLDALIDILGLIDSNKLLLGDNHTQINNDSILEIVLQHNIDKDRYVLFLFQLDFLEIQFDSYIEVYQYPDLIKNQEIKEQLRELVFFILDSSFKHVEYYENNKLIKYTSIWDNDFMPTKNIYVKSFGRIRERFSKKRQYLIKESRAESFLIDEYD